MNHLTPFIRIGLRIFGGFMIGRGYTDEATAAIFYEDPNLIGAIALGVSEGWYLLAKRFDWMK